jgi:hypothetical protein
MDRIQQYRQPMVTATGIFLGFMLDFVNSWMPNSFTAYKFRDAVLGIGAATSIALLIIVLFRILSMNYRPESADVFYKKTLRLFITGISIPFFSMVVVMFQKLVISIS